MSDSTKTRTGDVFKIKGIYFHDGFTVEPKTHAPLYWGREEWEREIKWLHAIGINAVEFATMFEFNRKPSTDMERKKIADRLRILELAHEFNMKFGYLLTNTTVSTVPEGEEPSHQGLGRAVELCPQEPGNFEKTIALQEWYMETFKNADFFEEFAGDWGGCTCGKCGVPDYLRYVEALSRKLAEVNPSAKLFADTWCISYWQGEPMKNGWKGVFDSEITGSREVIEAMPNLPDNVHFALPCHHLYRPLAFESYGGKNVTPPFPTADDVDSIHRAGREVLAWPHFVVDDDTGRAPAWGIVHSEVRYIQGLLRSLRSAGIDSVMCNLYLPYLQISNTYAYSRLLDDPDCDPQLIIREFAGLIVHPDDVDKLTDVFTWVENNSYWQIQMPEDGRLPNLSCSLTKESAIELANEIRPNPSPELPLPVTAASWLDDLRRSIPRMDWAE
ncbi:MAG: hypothetical protein ACYC27_07675 [Armatimonadota bacterium]